jgi:multiple sugar transport system permease protein
MSEAVMDSKKMPLKFFLFGLKSKKWPQLLTIHLVLTLMAVTMLAPLAWLISSALKMPNQQYTWPPQFIPNPIRWQNFTDLFQKVHMEIYLANSILVAFWSVVGMCLSSSLAAFGFARLRFWGRDIIFSILLATLMVPYAITMVPTFIIMRQLKWLDTLLPLIVPNFFGSGFMVFLLRQAYRGIPQDLVDAALMDGASYIQTYWFIFLPLGIPVMTTVALLTFLFSWNDLLGPLIYLNSPSRHTVQLGLALLKGRVGSQLQNTGVIMAGSLLGALPMLIMYTIGQKYFVQGLSRTGLKG